MQGLLQLYQPVGNMLRLNGVRSLLDGSAEVRDARLIHGGQVAYGLLEGGKLPSSACDLDVGAASGPLRRARTAAQGILGTLNGATRANRHGLLAV
jgi:hypothetical protein